MCVINHFRRKPAGSTHTMCHTFSSFKKNRIINKKSIPISSCCEPVSAIARAEPQSPILATRCPGVGSVMKILWLLRSRWMMGGDLWNMMTEIRLASDMVVAGASHLVCKYNIPSATSMQIDSFTIKGKSMLLSFNTIRNDPCTHNSLTILQEKVQLRCKIMHFKYANFRKINL